MGIAEVVANFALSLQILQARGQIQVLLVVWQGLSVFTSPAVEVAQVCWKKKKKLKSQFHFSILSKYLVPLSSMRLHPIQLA